jgi:peptidoglycan/xylan/chitin deacetylase (PgdA/CDA1 family)
MGEPQLALVSTMVKSLLKRLAHGLLAPMAPLVWGRRRQPRLLVLMYHRVLPVSHPERADEQPGMYVSPETLAMHLRVLQRHFDIVHLDEWLRRTAAQEPVPRLACALTFDDGWRDNFQYAFPVLRAAEAPATIYLLPDLVGTRYSFWPNRLARLLGNVANKELFPGWPVWLRDAVTHAVGGEGPLPLRMAQIDAVIDHCKRLYTDGALTEMLDGVDSRGSARAGERDLLDWEEAREMAASGLIRFGSHTRHHIRLDERASQDVLESEIRDSRTGIEQHLGTSVSSFCYPNGDHCPAAVELVRASYRSAVTTRKGWNSPSSDPHLLNRVGVHDDVSSTASAFLARLALAAR